VRYGLIGSILLHIVILGLVIFNFASRSDDAPKPSAPVSVEIMSPKDYSERQAGKADGKAEKPIPPAEVKAPEAVASAKKEVEQKPSPKPVEKEALLPPPPSPPPAAAAPAASPPPPKPVEVAKAEPRAEKPIEKPAEKPAPKPAVKKEPPPRPVKPKPEPKKAEEPEPKRTEARPFDPSRIEAFVNPERPQASQPRTAQSTMPMPPPKVFSDQQRAVVNRDPNAGAPSGDYDPSKPWRPASSLQEQAMGVAGARGAMNAGSCADAVQSRIEQNWILPIGGQAAETAIIRLHIELKRDGYLLRAPAVMERFYSPVQQAMADAAVRAAESGQPYNIPPQQYEQCRDMILRFNPRDMYGG
jgi:hypothetical protein